MSTTRALLAGALMTALATSCYVQTEPQRPVVVAEGEARPSERVAAERAYPEEPPPNEQVPARRGHTEPPPPPPPPPVDEPRDNEKVAARRGGQPQPPPPPPVEEPRGNEKVAARRGGQPQPPPPPPVEEQRSNEKVPAKRGGAQPPPPPPPVADRPNEKVPARRAKLGKAAEFSIEPTAGPVGTTVTIYGDFSAAMKARDVSVAFEGGRTAKPTSISTDAIVVVVPDRSKTGPVRVNINRRVMWTGKFAVTPKDDGFLEPTRGGEGLLGVVYKLKENTKKLPNFDGLSPFATIVVSRLAVAPRRFEQGFPGIEGDQELLEWFGIRFVGRIDIPADGTYEFKVNSDDGSVLYINGKKVVDNDGVHPPAAKTGSVRLTKGSHDIAVEYFQGPRYQIALELFWRTGGKGGWELVPAKALSRY